MQTGVDTSHEVDTFTYGTVGDYQYTVGYSMLDNGDLIVDVDAFTDPQGRSVNGLVGEQEIWNSRVTIKNYHPGDFGLTFVDDPNAGSEGAHLDPAVVASELALDERFVATVQEQSYVDDDASVNWNGQISYSNTSPSDRELSDDLKAVESDLPPSPSGPMLSAGDALASEASEITVSDTATNVAANLDALNDATNVAAITLDGEAPILEVSAAQVADDYIALGEITNSDYGIAVSDTAANVAANFDALDTNGQLASIMLTDAGTPTLDLSAGQAAYETDALSAITNSSFDVTVTDTALDVSAAIDALDDNTALSSITLTDSGTPTLLLTAGQALGDTTALGKITNSGYSIDVADTLDNVAANASALDGDASVSSIEIDDSATNVLGGETTISGLLSSEPKLSSVTVYDTAANVLGNLSALGSDGQITSINVADAAADISTEFDALNGASGITSIALVDFGTPTLELTSAQALGDTTARSKIANTDYVIDITDTVANVTTNATALDADDHVDAVGIVDTAANVLDGESALGGVAKLSSVQVSDTVADVLEALVDISDDGQVTSIVVVDTAANVAADLDALDAIPQLTSITLTDSGTPTLTLTAAQAMNDAAALDDITNTTYGVAISDTAANVAANIDKLNGISELASISLTDSGTPILTLNVDQATSDATAIGAITNASYDISVSDTAENVAAQIDALNGLTDLGTITLSDEGTPILDLSAAQALDDTTALNAVTGAYSVAVSDTAANILANATALDSDAHIGSLAVVDSAANVLDNQSALGALSLAAVTVSDTAANIIDNGEALAADSEISSIQVVDTAEDVATNLDALDETSKLTSITLTDAGTPTVDLTAEQALSDGGALADISNPYFVLTVSDTAANVLDNINELNGLSGLAGITLTDAGSPTLTLTAAEASGDSSVLEDISNTDYTIAVEDTAANVSTTLDGLESARGLTSITLTDAGTPAMELTAEQAATDGDALAKITNTGLTIDVSDTAADVSSLFDAIASDPAITSITLTDSGTPTLELTAQQALADSGTLNLIVTPGYEISVTDTAANVLDNFDGLDADDTVVVIYASDTVANVVANQAALDADPDLSFVTVVDTASNILAEQTTLDSDSLIVAFDVVDTAANVDSNLDELNSDLKLESITLTDAEMPTLVLTADQAANDTTALNDITNSDVALTVVDTAANVAANLDALASSQVSSISLSDIGPATIDLTADQAAFDTSAIAEIVNTDFTIAVTDTAANVDDDLSDLASIAEFTTITLTDASPTMNLSAARAVEYIAVLNDITNVDFEITITDTANNVAFYLDALGNLSNVASIHLTTPTITITAAQALSDAVTIAKFNDDATVVVEDTLANVVANASALNSDADVDAIDITDTASNILGGSSEISAILKLNWVTVSDTAANIVNNLASLSSDSQINEISLVDTAANVAAQLDQLNGITGDLVITLTDPETPLLPLNVRQTFDDSRALSAITSFYEIPLSDTASHVSALFDTLGYDYEITSVTLTDSGTPALTLTASQALNDTSTFSKITNSTYSVTVVDSAANVLDNLSAIEADSQITAITVLDSVANVLANETAIGAEPSIAAVGVSDTAVNILGSLSSLAADSQIGSIEVVDTAANLEALSATQIADLASIGSQHSISSSDASLTLSSDQMAAVTAAGITVSAPAGDTVTENFADGAQTVLSFDVADNLNSVARTNADGSHDITNYGITGQAYTAADIFFDADDNQLGALFFSPNGSVDATGTNTSLSISNASITVEADASTNISGSGDTIAVEDGGDAAITGSDDAVTMSGNGSVSINAAGSTVYADGNDNTMDDGGAGSATFILSQSFGDDFIYQFAATGSNQDVIQFDHSLFANYAAFDAASSDVDGNVVAQTTDGSVLTIANLQKSQLSSADFRFV